MTTASWDLPAALYDEPTSGETPRRSAVYVVESIGTFCLLVTVGLGLCTANPIAALGIGAVLMALMYAGGQLTGGSFNPAVTLAALLRGRIRASAALGCWCAQLAAAAAAAVVWCVVADRDQMATAAATMPSVGVLAGATVAGLLFAFTVSYVVLDGAGRDCGVPDGAADLAVGIGVITGAAALAAVADGAFDPAAALGSAVPGLFTWSTLVVLLVSEVIAGAFAAIAFLVFGGGSR